MLRFILSTLPFLLALVFLHGVEAQQSNATCTVANSWTLNSLGQSPCLVAAYVQGACISDGNWTVPALSNSNAGYAAPDSTQASICTCSSVTFSLLSACAFCQNGNNLLSYSEWITNCPTPLLGNGVYGHVIPPGTAIPAWAYLAIADPNNMWNPTTARAVADSNAPESTAVPTSSSSTSSSSSSSHHASNTSTPSPSPNTGAIVGGVVGGVLGLAILCLLGFFLYRYLKNKERRQVSTATPALFDPPSTQPSPAFMERKDQMSNYTASPGPPMSATHAPLKLYDPEDPTTFPDYQQPMPPMPQMSPSSGHTAPPSSPPHIIL